jgi:hypothetical protein
VHEHPRADVLGEGARAGAEDLVAGLEAVHILPDLLHTPAKSPPTCGLLGLRRLRSISGRSSSIGAATS